MLNIKKIIKTVVSGDSNITINNKSYSGSSVQISVIIDGKEVETLPINNKSINVEIKGDVESIVNSQGDIVCKNVNGNVKTSQGNIECGNVEGNVKTSQGNIDCNNVGGDVKTTLGSISFKK